MKFVLAVIVSVFLQSNAHLENFESLDLIEPGSVSPDNSPLKRIRRVVGGAEADPHSLPYSAAIYVKKLIGSSFYGGIIISDGFILTSAKCLDTARSVEVVVGAHNINNNEEGVVKMYVPRDNFIIHEDWNILTLANDIGLIKLPTKLVFTENIQPINLPTDSQIDEQFVSNIATASGWGRPSDNSGSISPVLRSVNVPVMSNDDCRAHFNIIKDSHICTDGTGGKGTCNGDAGGPLALEINGSKTLIGVASFGSTWGCEWGFPTVYTRITSFLSWIQSNI